MDDCQFFVRFDQPQEEFEALQYENINLSEQLEQRDLQFDVLGIDSICQSIVARVISQAIFQPAEALQQETRHQDKIIADKTTKTIYSVNENDKNIAGMTANDMKKQDSKAAARLKIRRYLKNRGPLTAR